jgi:hypothetical protein
MAVRLRDGVPVPTDYNKPITVVKYIHDAVVVATPFGVYILSPSSVAYVEGEKYAVADIKREGGRLRFEPWPEEDVKELKNIIRAYLPESLPPQLTRRGDKIYLGEAEVATIYELT